MFAAYHCASSKKVQVQQTKCTLAAPPRQQQLVRTRAAGEALFDSTKNETLQQMWSTRSVLLQFLEHAYPFDDSRRGWGGFNNKCGASEQQVGGGTCCTGGGSNSKWGAHHVFRLQLVVAFIKCTKSTFQTPLFKPHLEKSQLLSMSVAREVHFGRSSSKKHNRSVVVVRKREDARKGVQKATSWEKHHGLGSRSVPVKRFFPQLTRQFPMIRIYIADVSSFLLTRGCFALKQKFCTQRSAKY